MVVALEAMSIFNYNRATNEFKMSYLMFEQAAHHSTAHPLCAMSMLCDYKNQYFKQGKARGQAKGPGLGAQGAQEEVVDIDHSLKHLLLTGHKDGKILIWRLQSYIGVLDDCQVDVTAMSLCQEGVAFATITGLVYFWDSYLLKCHRRIDINQLPFKILSNFIVSMDFNQRRLLILTMNGDVVELQLGAGGGSSDGAVKANRVNSVVRLTCRQQRTFQDLHQSRFHVYSDFALMWMGPKPSVWTSTIRDSFISSMSARKVTTTPRRPSSGLNSDTNGTKPP